MRGECTTSRCPCCNAAVRDDATCRGRHLETGDGHLRLLMGHATLDDARLAVQGKCLLRVHVPGHVDLAMCFACPHLIAYRAAQTMRAGKSVLAMDHHLAKHSMHDMASAAVAVLRKYRHDLIDALQAEPAVAAVSEMDTLRREVHSLRAALAAATVSKQEMEAVRALDAKRSAQQARDYETQLVGARREIERLRGEMVRLESELCGNESNKRLTEEIARHSGTVASLHAMREERDKARLCIKQARGALDGELRGDDPKGRMDKRRMANALAAVMAALQGRGLPPSSGAEDNEPKSDRLQEAVAEARKAAAATEGRAD
jgi:hypothetical protein